MPDVCEAKVGLYLGGTCTACNGTGLAENQVIW